jgi:hypothetical protein
MYVCAGKFKLHFDINATSQIAQTEPFISPAITILSTRLFHNPKASFDRLLPSHPLYMMPGIGRLYSQRFGSMGISTIQQLASIVVSAMSEDDQRDMMEKLRKDKGTMTRAKLEEYVNQAREICKRETSASETEDSDDMSDSNESKKSQAVELLSVSSADFNRFSAFPRAHVHSVTSNVKNQTIYTSPNVQSMATPTVATVVSSLPNRLHSLSSDALSISNSHQSPTSATLSSASPPTQFLQTTSVQAQSPPATSTRLPIPKFTSGGETSLASPVSRKRSMSVFVSTEAFKSLNPPMNASFVVPGSLASAKRKRAVNEVTDEDLLEDAAALLQLKLGHQGRERSKTF